MICPDGRTCQNVRIREKLDEVCLLIRYGSKKIIED